MTKGPDGFETHFSSLFGPRWPDLRAALHGPVQYAELQIGDCPVYFLDRASFAAAHLLPLEGAERILDLCAAPGGKSLVLAMRMGPETTLVCNDRSSERRARLHRVIAEYTPADIGRRVEITAHDARRFGLFEAHRYDAVLADVPCSSERHVIGSPIHLSRWNVGTIKRLSATQYAILAAAIDCTRTGGHILYATCALSSTENDIVVARALRKRSAVVESIPLSAAAVAPFGIEAEPTAHGLQILPDRGSGSGPLYCALLRRR